MTLTQQFILVSFFPLSFLGMIVYLWRAQIQRRSLIAGWTLTLLVTAVWASSVLRYYGGIRFDSNVVIAWGAFGRYCFTLTTLTLLYATTLRLGLPRPKSLFTVLFCAAFGLIAFGIDPVIWPVRLPLWELNGRLIGSFEVWAGVWVVSWLIPLIAAWILLQQINHSLPQSLYRNQIHYWFVVIFLYMAGGVFASIYQPGQPGWQELSFLLIIPAAWIGSVSLVYTPLPNLQHAARQVLARLSGTLIVFALTWLAFYLIANNLTRLPNAQTSPLIPAAAIFAAAFTVTYRLVNRVMQQVFLPSPKQKAVLMADYTNAIGNLPEPVQLGELLLRIVQSSVDVSEGWAFAASDGPGGKLLLRPLATLTLPLPDPIDLSGHSPLANHFRQQHIPLLQSDIDGLVAFDHMSPSERTILQKWQKSLFMPLHAGDSLIGLVVLGKKGSNELFNPTDFELLNALSSQIGPLLAQAQNLQNLRRINQYVFQQNQALAREQRHLQELTHLYDQFMQLIGPDLRDPFTPLYKRLQRVKDDAPEVEKKLAHDISEGLNNLKDPVDNLINLSVRLQKREMFHFEQLNLHDVAELAIRSLATMAEARRVRIELDKQSPSTAVIGDARQLQEAIQNLLHNAIKFNKIGGVVRLECGATSEEVYLRVVDTGVGIPPERLENLWDGFKRVEKIRNVVRGPGLGLTLTKFIIAAHNGRIEAHSKYGAGSNFAFYLPLVFDE